MPEPKSAAPPGTEGAVTSLIAGATALVVAVLLIVVATTAVDPDSTAWTVIVALGGLAGVTGVFVGNAGLQRLRARRTAIATGPHEWAGLAVRAENNLALCLLMINTTGVHLHTTGGGHLETWPWPTIATATGLPATVRGREQPALTLDLKDGAGTLAFAFPTGVGVGYSAASAERALAITKTHL